MTTAKREIRAIRLFACIVLHLAGRPFGTSQKAGGVEAVDPRGDMIGSPTLSQRAV